MTDKQPKENKTIKKLKKEFLSEFTKEWCGCPNDFRVDGQNAGDVWEWINKNYTPKPQAPNHTASLDPIMDYKWRDMTVEEKLEALKQVVEGLAGAVK